MVADGVSARQNLVNIISVCKSDKSKASMSLLGCGWVLGDVCILQIDMAFQQCTSTIAALLH